MSKIDDLNIQPKFDNALQVQRTANIPDNEKYKASEWNALISKTNEVVGRANLNTWSIATNYSELPTDPVNGQKVYVTGTGLNGHVSVQMMPNGKTSRGFYVYDAFSDIWVQKTSESELSAITFSIDTNWSGLPDEPNQGDIFELTTNDTPIPANVIGVVDPNETAGKYQFNGTVWVAKSDTVLYQEVLAMLEDKLDLDMNNLAGDLTEQEQDTIKAKLGIGEGGSGLATDMSNLDDDLDVVDQQAIKTKLGIDEGGGELKKIGNGYGLQHQIDNPDNYGTLGANAVNLSFSVSEGDFGATGDSSHAEGLNTTASGAGSHAEGVMTSASGIHSHAEGNNTTTSGYASHAEGDSTTASGYASHTEGCFTTAGSLGENARGVYSEIITPISETTFNENDVIESVGVGTNPSNRKNALTRWKNGAFKWLLQPLTNITNAVLGFHAADEDGRLNYYDGTAWKKYLLEGEGSGGGSGIQNLGEETTQEDFQTMASGIYYGNDSIVLGYHNFDGFVKVSEWELNHRTIEITGWFDNADELQSHYYWLTDNQDTTFTLTHLGNAFEVNSIKEQNNDYYLSFWRGTQAEYDALTTKNTQTLYIVSNSGLIGNGVTPTVTASVITNYDIDVATQTEHWNLTMTGDTDFDFANMFASGNSKVITITLEGDYAFTFPSWLKPLETNDDYDTIGGTLVAEIVINIKNGGANPSGYYSLQMVDYAS